MHIIYHSQHTIQCVLCRAHTPLGFTPSSDGYFPSQNAEWSKRDISGEQQWQQVFMMSRQIESGVMWLEVVVMILLGSIFTFPKVFDSGVFW